MQRICLSLVLGLLLAGSSEAARPTKYQVTVNVSAGGSVTSSTGGISCPGTCSTSVNSGTSITFMATPDAGATFTGWGGDCAVAGSVPICELVIDSAKSIEAAWTTEPSIPEVYVFDVGPELVGAWQPVDMAIIDAMCRDFDGCEITTSAIDFDPSMPGAVFSRSIRHFISETSRWYSSDITVNNFQDGDGIYTSIFSVPGCEITDADTLSGEDLGEGYSVLNRYMGWPQQPLCRLIIKD